MGVGAGCTAAALAELMELAHLGPCARLLVVVAVVVIVVECYCILLDFVVDVLEP